MMRPVLNQIKQQLRGLQHQVRVNIPVKLTGVNAAKSQLSGLKGGSVSMKVEMEGVTQAKSAIGGIDGKTVTVAAKTEGDAAIQRLKGAVSGLQDKSVSAEVKSLGASDLFTLVSSVANLKGKSVDAEVKAMGAGDLFTLANAVANLRPKSVDAEVKASGAADLFTLASAIANLDSKSVDAEVKSTGADDLFTLASAIANLDSKSVDAEVKSIGSADLFSLVSAVANLQDKSVDAVVKSSGAADVFTLASAIANLDSKSVDAEVKSTGAADLFTLASAIANLDSKSVDAEVKSTGAADLFTLASAISNLDSKSVDAEVKSTGAADLFTLSSAIANLDSKSVDAEVKSMGAADLFTLASALANLQPKTVDAEVKSSGADDLFTLASAVANLQPKSVDAEVKSIGAADLLTLASAIAGLRSKSVDAEVRSSGAADLFTLSSAIANLQPKTVDAEVKSSGADDLFTLASAIANLQPKSVDAEVKSIGAADLFTLASAVANLQDKSVSAEVKSEGATGLLELVSGIAGLQDKTVNAAVKSTGDTDLQTLVTGIANLVDKTVNAEVKSAGAADLFSLASGIANLQDKTVNAAVKSSGDADLQTLVTGIQNLSDKTVNAAVKSDGASDLFTLVSGMANLRDKTVNAAVKSDGGANLQELVTGIQALVDKTVNAAVKSTGGADLQTLVTSIGNLTDKSVTAAVKTDGAADLFSLVSGMANLQDKTVTAAIKTDGDANLQTLVTGMSALQDKSVTAAVKTDGLGDLFSLRSGIAGVQDKTVTVTVNVDDSQLSNLNLSKSAGAITVPVRPDTSVHAQQAFNADMRIFLDQILGVSGIRLPVSLGSMGAWALPALGGALAFTGFRTEAIYGQRRDSVLANEEEYRKGTTEIREAIEENFDKFITSAVTSGEKASFTNTQLAEMTEILRVNGLSLDQIMQDVTYVDDSGEEKSANLLEIARDITVALARGPEDPSIYGNLVADLMTDVMIQFGKGSEDLPDIKTLLVNMQKESKANLQDIAYFFAAGGGMASQFGVSLEDFTTMGTIAMPFFRSGMDLGTSMKMMFQNMGLLTGTDYENLAKYNLLHEETIGYNKALSAPTIAGGQPIFYTEGGTAEDPDQVRVMLMNAVEGLNSLERTRFVTEGFGQSFLGPINRIIAGEGTDKDFERLRTKSANLSQKQMALLHQRGLMRNVTFAGPSDDRKVISGTPLWYERSVDEETGKVSEEFVGAEKFISLMKPILDEMTSFERSSFLGEWLGSDAIRGGAALFGIEAKEFEQLQTELMKATADDIKDIKEGNVRGEWKTMVALLQAITLGTFKNSEKLASTVLSIANTGLEMFLPDESREQAYTKMDEEIAFKRQFGIRMTEEEKLREKDIRIAQLAEEQDPAAMQLILNLLHRGEKRGGVSGELMEIAGGLMLAYQQAYHDDPELQALLDEALTTDFQELGAEAKAFVVEFAHKLFAARGEDPDAAFQEHLGQMIEQGGFAETPETRMLRQLPAGTDTKTFWKFREFLDTELQQMYSDFWLTPEARRGNLQWEPPEMTDDFVGNMWIKFIDQHMRTTYAQPDDRLLEGGSVPTYLSTDTQYAPIEGSEAGATRTAATGVAGSEVVEYLIRQGDTLKEIADARGTTVEALAELNNIVNVDVIITGETLLIPDADADSDGATTTTTTRKTTSGSGKAWRNRRRGNTTGAAGPVVPLTEEEIFLMEGMIDPFGTMVTPPPPTPGEGTGLWVGGDTGTTGAPADGTYTVPRTTPTTSSGIPSNIPIASPGLPPALQDEIADAAEGMDMSVSAFDQSVDRFGQHVNELGLAIPGALPGDTVVPPTYHTGQGEEDEPPSITMPTYTDTGTMTEWERQQIGGTPAVTITTMSPEDDQYATQGVVLGQRPSVSMDLVAEEDWLNEQRPGLVAPPVPWEQTLHMPYTSTRGAAGYTGQGEETEPLHPDTFVTRVHTDASTAVQRDLNAGGPYTVDVQANIQGLDSVGGHITATPSEPQIVPDTGELSTQAESRKIGKSQKQNSGGLSASSIR